MSAAEVVSRIKTCAPGFTTALTWVPPAAMRALTWGSGVENEPEALQSVASALHVDLCFVPSHVEWSVEALARLAELPVARGWIVAGVLGRLAEAVGWSEVIRASAADPLMLAEGLEKAFAEAMAEVSTGLRHGADVLMVADDLAGAGGWLVAPDFAMESLLPRYEALVCGWTSEGATIFHSDGDVRALFSGLRAAGFHGVHLASLAGRAFELVLEAAGSCGLYSMGGIPAVRLTQRYARGAGVRAGKLSNRGALIVADDGAITSGEQLAEYGVALRAAAQAADDAGQGRTPSL